MSEFLAPINYDRARDVLRRLSFYTRYTPEDAQAALLVLEQCYPALFSRMEKKEFTHQAVLLELPGGERSGPLVFASHLDAPEGTPIVDCPHELPLSVPLSRAHLITLLEALDALVGEGYVPGGDLMLAISMDGLSGAEGAKSIAAHLRARSVNPCFVLDYGGYATMDAFRTYLPKGAPLALIGIAEKGELHGRLTADEAVCARRGCNHLQPVNELLKAGRRLTRHPWHASLCPASERMLRTIGQKAPLLQRSFVKHPHITFPLMRLMWRNRAILRQFFFSERTVYALSASGTQLNPPREASLRFSQTLIPGVKNAEYRHHLRDVAGNTDLKLEITVDHEADAMSEASGEAWDALSTAIEIQFDRVVIAPSLAPFPTDARFYSQLGGKTYRFSPFMVSGSEALKGLCTITDGTLQTAVQFFRSMLSV